MDPITELNLQQQEILGVVGVNLIYAVFHSRQFAENSWKTLLDEVSSQRRRIDFIELREPAFAGWNHQKTLLSLSAEAWLTPFSLPLESASPHP